MKPLPALLLLLAAALPHAAGSKTMTDTPHQAEVKLWYRQPARAWMEALPVGNGRLGAMVFGATDRERVQLNEHTLWDGHRQDTTNPEALQYLPEVRRLLFQGKNEEATKLAGEHLMGRPLRIKSYQSLGDLWLDFEQAGLVADYRRELDLDTGIARVSYRSGDRTFTREVFASGPGQAIVIRLISDKPGGISLHAGMSREQDAECVSYGKDGLRLRGQVQDRNEASKESPGVRFEAQLVALPTGGSVLSENGVLNVRGADALTLLLTAATSFRGDDPEKSCTRARERIREKAYDALRSQHVADHQKLFRRVVLDLGHGPNEELPTDERLAAVQKGADDPGLVTLYFQFGRYLLMGSSRPGGLPANLQGLWNEHMKAPWNSDYHTNINVQMNYWPAEVTNLTECHEPLLDFIGTLVEPGGRTAKVHYGCRGWVVHHLTDVWGFTTPADGIQGVWPMGGAWLAQHLWEHYTYTGDRKYLKERAYPLMKGAARFCLDFLVEEPGTGRLVTNPSHSPENRFRKPDGTESKFTYGATMDLEILHDLFTNCIHASEVLDTDREFREELQSALKRLAPLQVSKKTGRLQEWIEDYDEPEPGHRHLSHLFALHPGDQITLRGKPELATAARKSLEYRLSHGGGHTGWSRAWIINFWARLEEGDQAYTHLKALLQKSTAQNLFDLHPPFQIDGNFGGTAGIAEMLLQSHAGEVSLLPALPKAWPSGSVTGLRARGGYEVGMSWQAGVLRTATLQPAQTGPCALRVPKGQPVREVLIDGEPVAVQKTTDAALVRFEARAGKSYEVRL